MRVESILAFDIFGLYIGRQLTLFYENRLKQEKKAWQALARPLPEVEPLYPDPNDTTEAPLPDEDALDPEEARMLSTLTNPETSFGQLRRKTKARLQKIQQSLEFKQGSQHLVMADAGALPFSDMRELL